VEQELGLRSLLREEISGALNRPIESCALKDLATNPSLAIGALTVAAQYAIGDIDLIVPKSRPAIPVAFSVADEELEILRRLQKPSIIAIISVSEVFLKTALSLLAPEAGQRHTLREFHVPLDHPTGLKATDLVFADSIVRPQIKHPKVIQYLLIDRRSLDCLVNAMKSYESS
jgi:hypothetical protein